MREAMVAPEDLKKGDRVRFFKQVSTVTEIEQAVWSEIPGRTLAGVPAFYYIIRLDTSMPVVVSRFSTVPTMVE